MRALGRISAAVLTATWRHRYDCSSSVGFVATRGREFFPLWLKRLHGVIGRAAASGGKRLVVFLFFLLFFSPISRLVLKSEF